MMDTFDDLKTAFGDQKFDFFKESKCRQYM